MYVVDKNTNTDTIAITIMIIVTTISTITIVDIVAIIVTFDVAISQHAKLISIHSNRCKFGCSGVAKNGL